MIRNMLIPGEDTEGNNSGGISQRTFSLVLVVSISCSSLLAVTPGGFYQLPKTAVIGSLAPHGRELLLYDWRVKSPSHLHQKTAPKTSAGISRDHCGISRKIISDDSKPSCRAGQLVSVTHKTALSQLSSLHRFHSSQGKLSRMPFTAQSATVQSTLTLLTPVTSNLQYLRLTNNPVFNISSHKAQQHPCKQSHKNILG